jgi:ssDNA-binding Zn-finger/Zn-ribbon topoisomerase 1
MASEFKIKLTPDVKILNASCKHCGKPMISKNYCDEDGFLIIDKNAYKTTGEYVLSEEKCPDCGCNLFDIEIATTFIYESKQI